MVSSRVVHCAEAIVDIREDLVYKRRIPKDYRIKELDERIRRERTRFEAKILKEARKLGVPTPIVLDCWRDTITMEYIEGVQLKDCITEKYSEIAGELVGRLHSGGIIHGDLTTSNMIVSHDRIYLIDFGLSFYDQTVEARGVDLHVFFQTLKSTHEDYERLIEAFKRGYRRQFDQAEPVLRRVSEIEARGRYK
ncbi:MAG TPA: Kae1-associated kinase Bud32 [Candidatus Syntrophoarchaeum butanivorans]|uniref:non-specific serine/threonine protein kinase n=1 Tax=Candidatus Syntropharchaeum butanivorans TaxID=1839936 RepID=A0A7C0X3L4_9EURY|nr:Kae1-associated kinase Bud32 [Candidatus Syntrophoarchaeum butanivorans]